MGRDSVMVMIYCVKQAVGLGCFDDEIDVGMRRMYSRLNKFARFFVVKGDFRGMLDARFIQVVFRRK